MSYNYPTAQFNSAGEERDPIRGSRLDAANRTYDEYFAKPNPKADQSPFSSWQRFTEDVLHYRPIDSLPQEERDAIRIRRRRAYQESDVPWIITDFTSLMTAYDDVDDLLKTKTLLKDYALTPAARAARKLLKGRRLDADEKITGWREGCDVPAPPREKKLLVPGFGGLNLLAALGLGALGVLFPQWRLLSLLLQAAQTTDALFGVGLQLGPILGYLMETTFRRIRDVNGPIFDFDSKYEQLKAARVIRNSNRALAAANHAKGDDAFTSLTGLYYASDRDVLPRLVIDQEDYPSVSEVFEHPWQIGKEAFDAARLAASLPYNLGAAAVNGLLGDALAAWSAATGGPGAAGMPGFTPDNETRGLMQLTEDGICPSGQCEGEALQQAAVLFHITGRTDPTDGDAMKPRDAARRLEMHVTPDYSDKQLGQTPTP